MLWWWQLDLDAKALDELVLIDCVLGCLGEPSPLPPQVFC